MKPFPHVDWSEADGPFELHEQVIVEIDELVLHGRDLASCGECPGPPRAQAGIRMELGRFTPVALLMFAEDRREPLAASEFAFAGRSKRSLLWIRH